MKNPYVKSKPILKERCHVKTIGFFGSYARGEQNPKSDIDILVEFVEGNSVDLFDFIELEDFLTEQLGVKVDLAKKALKY